jgi:hypothetical protein
MHVYVIKLYRQSVSVLYIAEVNSYLNQFLENMNILCEYIILKISCNIR